MLKEKVKEYRTKNKLTQKEFANKLGISRGYLADIESGKVKGNIRILKALASATNIPVNYWVNDDDELDMQPFEVLNTILDDYIKIGLIKKDYMANGVPEVLIEVIKQEINLKIERIEKSNK